MLPDVERTSFSSDGAVVLVRPARGWIGGMAAAFLTGTFGVGFSILSGAFVLAGTWEVGVGMLGLAICMFLLTAYVWRDSQARRTWRVEMEPGELRLDLPAGRSLMEAGQRMRCFLEVSDIAAIETRLEAFRSFGLANIQRNYGLRMKSGDLIVLGEDRALATGLADVTIGGFVETIRVKTGLPLHDLGMVEGKGGFLGLLFTSVPSCDAPRVPTAVQNMLWRRTVVTGSLAGAVFLTAILLSVSL